MPHLKLPNRGDDRLPGVIRQIQTRQGQQFMAKLLDPDLKVSGGREVFPRVSGGREPPVPRLLPADPRSRSAALHLRQELVTKRDRTGFMN